MKIIFLFSVLLLSSGCQYYSRAKVGPDRFSYSSRDRSAADHTKLLQMAYGECQANGFKDYRILNDGPGDRGLELTVQCIPQTMNYTPVVYSTPQTNQQPPNQPTPSEPLSSAASKMWEEFKKTFQ